MVQALGKFTEIYRTLELVAHTQENIPQRTPSHRSVGQDM